VAQIARELRSARVAVGGLATEATLDQTRDRGRDGRDVDHFGHVLRRDGGEEQAPTPPSIDAIEAMIAKVPEPRRL
jgi:hypothetical protein